MAKPGLSKQASQSAASSMASVTSSSRLTKTSEIVRLLKRVQAARTVLTVGILPGDGAYTSSIVDIDEASNRLLLDELSPVEGHKKVAGGTGLRLFGRLDGIEVGFAVEVEVVDESEDIALYRVPLPNQLHYNQRREFHRVRPHHDVQIRIRTAQGQSLESSLRDISLGGISVQTRSTGNQSWLTNGAMLLCDMSIGKGAARVVTPIEVRHVHRNPTSGTDIVGTRFTGLNPQQRRAVQRYIASIDRDLVKSRLRSI